MSGNFSEAKRFSLGAPGKLTLKDGKTIEVFVTTSGKRGSTVIVTSPVPRKDPTLRAMAEKIIAAQEAEIAELEKWQQEHGMLLASNLKHAHSMPNNMPARGRTINKMLKGIKMQ